MILGLIKEEFPKLKGDEPEMWGVLIFLGLFMVGGIIAMITAWIGSRRS